MRMSHLVATAVAARIGTACQCTAGNLSRGGQSGLDRPGRALRRSTRDRCRLELLDRCHSNQRRRLLNWRGKPGVYVSQRNRDHTELVLHVRRALQVGTVHAIPQRVRTFSIQDRSDHVDLRRQAGGRFLASKASSWRDPVLTLAATSGQTIEQEITAPTTDSKVQPL